ncbi:hypothetical protein E2C01_008118 [Portunus trituberculatus]|uniref:Uncharacterized protein n=1 Tax=Portunus trituberculatus TaxID=210409 RepID=A0A5B7D290_PORTR|nr:hypothetical protein [Portunus trituberculatus]
MTKLKQERGEERPSGMVSHGKKYYHAEHHCHNHHTILTATTNTTTTNNKNNSNNNSPRELRHRAREPTMQGHSKAAVFPVSDNYISITAEVIVGSFDHHLQM